MANNGFDAISSTIFFTDFDKYSEKKCFDAHKKYLRGVFQHIIWIFASLVDKKLKMLVPFNRKSFRRCYWLYGFAMNARMWCDIKEKPAEDFDSSSCSFWRFRLRKPDCIGILPPITWKPSAEYSLPSQSVLQTKSCILRFCSSRELAAIES